MRLRSLGWAAVPLLVLSCAGVHRLLHGWVVDTRAAEVMLTHGFDERAVALLFSFFAVRFILIGLGPAALLVWLTSGAYALWRRARDRATTPSAAAAPKA